MIKCTTFVKKTSGHQTRACTIISKVQFASRLLTYNCSFQLREHKQNLI